MIDVIEVEEVKEAMEETAEELLWDSLVLQAGTIASWWDQGLAFAPGALGALGPWSPGVLGVLQKAGQASQLVSRLARMPSYQAALLLTEHHLMQGDGALAPGLRHALATIALDKLSKGGAREFHDSVLGNVDKVEVAVPVRDWGKLAILQRVERVLAMKPWALNRFHVQEMQAIGLSISEIIHCVLILAHFHALSGLSEGLQLPTSHQSSSQRPKTRSLSLQQQQQAARPRQSQNNKITKRRRVQSQVERRDQNFLEEEFQPGLLNDPCKVLLNEQQDPLQSRLNETFCCSQNLEHNVGLIPNSHSDAAVGLESTWDDFGFPVLSCLSEAAALVLDNRFARLPHRNRGAARYAGLWTYAQHLFGCHPEGQCPQVTPEEKNLVISCLLPQQTTSVKEISITNKVAKEVNRNPKEVSRSPELASLPPLPALVTVCEARMQAEILHGLQAVTQFMKS